MYRSSNFKLLWKRGCYPFYGLIHRVRYQVLKICDGELGVCWVRDYIPKIYHTHNRLFLWEIVMLYLVKAVLWKGTKSWPAWTTAQAQIWHLFAGDASWFWPSHIHYFVLCGQTLLLFGLSKVFLLHSSDAMLYLSMFQAPSPAENGLSGLLEGKFLESLNDSESF